MSPRAVVSNLLLIADRKLFTRRGSHRDISIKS